LKRDRLFGLPVIAVDEMELRYPPSEHEFFAAMVYTQGNRLRARLYTEAKAKGYRPASYVSPHAFLWRNVQLGEHCFVFEHNVLQPYVTVGDDVILWSGNHIGHHSTIASHTFFASHVVLSGFCNVGESCFLGVNATIANNITIGHRVTIGSGANVIGNVPDDQVVVGLWKQNKPL